MKTHHTPGPWELRGPRLVTDKNGVIIAENISSNGGTSEANARLIKSSPRLLEVLMEIDEALRHSPDYGAFVTLSNGWNIQPRGRVLAAIREATGEQS